MSRTRCQWVVLALGLVCTTGAQAALEGPGRTQFLQAARAEGPVEVDGRLDEAAWRQAPVFDGFVQNFPLASHAPSERTELRVLYDARHLYVGVTCFDSQPERINHNLGRRDSDLFSDVVRVLLDTTHEHRTAYTFTVNAGGVQSDGLYYDDREFTSDWDGVWDAAAGRFDGGWVAEFAIPLSLLRFPAAPLQTWGFSVRREIARLNEQLETVDNPPGSNAVVSRLGHLTGLEGLGAAHHTTQLLPYLSARGVLRPQYSDPARPLPRLADPSLDVGLDFKTALTRGLALTGTLNPDFGQVEADQLLLNLTTFETFFPEKRPFFTQGLELFNPVADSINPQTLFYSRRIGLQTPILGAVKLTGTVVPGVEVGLLDALVTGPWARDVDESQPDRRVGFYGSRPLHLALNDTLPGAPVVPMNYLTAVVRGRVGAGSRVGGMATLASPLVGPCPETADDASPPASCLAMGGNAAAVDLDLKTASGEYGLMGQVDGSQSVGGPAERLLRDGTLLRRGDTGLGSFVVAGRFGGEGVRWELRDEFASPRLDLNASGYQPTQNRHQATAVIKYVRANGLGPLRSYSAKLSGTAQWTTDGRGLSRGSGVTGYTEATLPSFDTFFLEAHAEGGGWDVRQLTGSGVPLEQERSGYVLVGAQTNPNRRFEVNALAALAPHFRVGPAGPVGIAWGSLVDVTAALRPHPSVETLLQVVFDRTPTPPRLIEDLGGERFLLRRLMSDTLSLTLRQQWVLTPRLTFQAYAQLFTASGRYGDAYEGVSDADHTPIRFSSLRPVERTVSDDYHEVGLNLNVVLRWEYRLGSTLYLVYTRGQQRLPVEPGAPPPHTLLPTGLLAGAATDALLLKWSWFWDV